MWHITSLSVVAALLTFLASVSASLLNITIDDQYGDPQTGLSILYSPSSAWQNGQSCDNCTAQPDANQAYMQTWKIATYNLSEVEVEASVTFTGVAIYVKCILTNSTYGTTDLNFYIDDENVGSYAGTADGNSSYEYGVTVFSRQGLSNELHTLTIESAKSDSSSLIILDSITYSSEQNGTLTSTSISSGATSSSNATTTTSSSSHTGAIVGGVLGGLAGIGIIAGVVLFLWQRKNRNHRRQGGTSVLLDLADRGMPGRYSGSEARATPFILDHKASITTKVSVSRSSEDSSDRTSFWTDVRTTADVGTGFKNKSKSKSKGAKNSSQDMGRSLRPDILEDLKPPAYTYDDGPPIFNPDAKS